ncbi:MAG: hypothetical protein E4G93_05135 [Dehalococcoidia bacterium]|nr:MAG: hypothetical protein E4G93_05135 [Dehalococcoidia bacterium]
MITKRRLAWGWLGVLLLVDLIVPWYVLGGHPHFTGAFLFWVVWTAVAIVSMFVLFLRWRE